MTPLAMSGRRMTPLAMSGRRMTPLAMSGHGAAQPVTEGHRRVRMWPFAHMRSLAARMAVPPEWSIAPDAGSRRSCGA